jgi:hypothetical protein
MQYYFRGYFLMEFSVIRKALILCGMVAAICCSIAVAEDAPHVHFT